MFEMMKVLVDAYPKAYQTLYEAKPITCSVTGTTFDAIPAPCAAVLDVSQFYWYVTVDGDASLRLFFHFFISSSLHYLNYMPLEQSVGILCQ